LDSKRSTINAVTAQKGLKVGQPTRNGKCGNGSKGTESWSANGQRQMREMLEDDSQLGSLKETVNTHKSAYKRIWGLPST